MGGKKSERAYCARVHAVARWSRADAFEAEMFLTTLKYLSCKRAKNVHDTKNTGKHSFPRDLCSRIITLNDTNAHWLVKARACRGREGDRMPQHEMRFGKIDED